ncbi:lysophospholipid acyltransferase family protein [Palleronia caenipelagi]|uniref:1-acyl-sn-glycerol-3-phosphate acyltransferase n=1 Tax=Palleronia caenipelagi TaxID=2489174 RepID=A0A547Q2W9_9RHOB|nr:lysophospholipid acyltransferase family protein [Palleronia caenipelagi]TRD20719.1 1-acyl-sn-glycerol-3-phosphate acyltransferase [Palleronia caenipelagi]
MIQWLRSLVFTTQMYLVMAILGLWYIPIALRHEDGAHRGIRTYCRYVRWSARWMINLDSEIRGDIPQGEVLIAAKHQSFFDIIIMCSVLEAPKFIMKKELIRAPFLGWFALKIGCIPVDRGKKGEAVKQMLRALDENRGRPGQLIIYPQGTRVAPGRQLPYKVGPSILYTHLDRACIPVAVNVGVFWPRIGIGKKQGLAVVEFLDPIAPGMEGKAFLAELEERVESRSTELMAEVGFQVPA